MWIIICEYSSFYKDSSNFDANIQPRRRKRIRMVDDIRNGRTYAEMKRNGNVKGRMNHEEPTFGHEEPTFGSLP